MARHACTQQPLSLSNPIRPQRTSTKNANFPESAAPTRLFSIIFMILYDLRLIFQSFERNFKDRSYSMQWKFKNWLRSRKFWKRFVLTVILIPIILLTTVITIVYFKQDAIVQDLIADLNKDFNGATEIRGSHISLFENFPYISIDLEGFKVYESKTKNGKPIVNVKDAYIGFNLWTVLSGDMKIKKIKLKGGHIDLIEHENGEFNIVKALSPTKEIESPEEEFHLDLKRVELENIDFTKLNESNGLKVEAFVDQASSKFQTSGKHVLAALDAKFVLNIISNGDTTFFKHKHVDLSTHVDFVKVKDIMTIQPTTVKIEGAEFSMKGSIDFLKDVLLDLDFKVNKNNFDLFIALAPEELMKTLQTFENKGNIYLKTKIKGRSINGFKPEINAQFGCKNGYFKNKKNGRTLKGLAFEGSFTNGADHTIETMQFKLSKIHAKPGPGTISGNVFVKNFKAPEVLLDAKANLNLSFISKFLSMEHIDGLGGTAKLDINYHDVIDLENPEEALSDLNQKYSMSIALENVQLTSDKLPVPIHDLDLITEISGHEAAIIKFNLKAGKSDLKLTGSIDDLPAIAHHTDIPVDTRLKIESKFLDLYELTGSDSSAIDEQITDLSLNFDFKSSARSFTESKYLPKGEFFIENLYAKLKHYPHTLHDFHADIFVEEQDLKVADFSGMIDQSDFHFTGKLEHYEKWFDAHPDGDSKIEFDLASKQLQLESFFTYKGENYVPEDYRHEEFDNLHVHGFTYLHYADELKSIDLMIDKLEAKMKIHPLRLEQFKGRIHYENDHLIVEDFHGKMGSSDIQTTLHYYLGDDKKTRLRDNHFAIKSKRLDFDQLMNYTPPPKTVGKNTSVNHDAGFNIYELPFTNMTYDLDIGQLKYHRYNISKLKGKLRTTPEHYLYIDDLALNLAGGHFDVKGYFNGSNPDLIYFSPEIHAKNVDIDQLMFKFENFGQDYLVSKNLHGSFSGTITGKIHVHSDFVPKLDDSEIHIDLDVTQGRLENYSLLEYMSEYFQDKNLNKVLFDTLNNHLDVENGVVIIPKMTVNSSLGHLEISGKQDLNGKMEYYLRIPWRMVTKTAGSKLFGGKKEDEIPSEQMDEIQYGTSKTKYVNIVIVGDENGYKFSVGKKKK